MNDELKARCFAVAQVNPGSAKASVVEQAAGFADEWYSANPMPMGSPIAAERHHVVCRNHVTNQVRMKCGLFAMMGLFASLLSICHTVWNWRKSVPADVTPTE